jgi:threonine/homoserine/homoserine lactone efflux protein
MRPRYSSRERSSLASSSLALFALAALIMVMTPGPNMIYLVSRSLCQGRKAGIISLLGVAVGFLVHMFAAAIGRTAMFMATPRSRCSTCRSSPSS